MGVFLFFFLPFLSFRAAQVGLKLATLLPQLPNYWE